MVCSDFFRLFSGRIRKKYMNTNIKTIKIMLSKVVPSS